MLTEREKLLKHWDDNQDKFSPDEWKIILKAQRLGFKNFQKFYDLCKSQYGHTKAKRVFLDELLMYIEDMKIVDRFHIKFEDHLFQNALDEVDKVMNDNYKNRTTKAS